MNRTSKSTDIILYHANCLDGFGSAYIAMKTLNIEEKNTLAMQYDKSAIYTHLLDFISGKKLRTVYILDFSLPIHLMETLSTIAKKVVLIDHHKTAIEMYEGWKHPKNIELILNINYSGVGLTAKYFNYPVTRWVTYIQDRDLWKFNYKNSKAFCAKISKITKNFETWNTVLNSIILSPSYFTHFIEEGEKLLEKNEALINSYLEQSFSYLIDSIHAGLACIIKEKDRCILSELGHKLAEKSGTFGAIITEKADGTLSNIISLRSIGNYDVEKLAKLQGGGGHKNAAGYTLS